MKRIFATLLITIAASMTVHAAGYRQNLPSLVCQDELLRIPERGFQVEVFAKSSFRPDVTVTVQAVDTNLGNEVIYTGPVQEQIADYTSQFVGENMHMSLVAEVTGGIRGQIVLANGEETMAIPVSCKKFYHIMKPLVAQ